MPANESFDGSAEDRRPKTPSPAPRDTGSASGQAVCHRRTGRQATSAVAYTSTELDADDPLLAFAPHIHPHPRSNSITPERQRRFVATLAATGIVTQALRLFRSMTLCQVCQAPALRQQSGSATRTHKPDNALLRFLLQHRLPQRYGVHNPGHAIRSGHPVYESIRRQVLEKQRRKRAANEQAVFASIDRKLALIRERYGIAEGDGD